MQVVIVVCSHPDVRNDTFKITREIKMPASRALMLKSFAAAVFATGLMATLPAAAQNMPVLYSAESVPSNLTLSVTQSISAAPDMGSVNFAVVTQGKTASETMKANNVRMNAVFAALKTAGIATKDIQTSGINLTPQYVYKENMPAQLSGYESRNQLSVRVNDLTQLGPVIDAVIKAGINQIDSIGFSLKNQDAALDTARKDAVTKLLQRAQLYAAASGMKVKRILTLSASDDNYESPRPMMMAMAKMSGDESTPVAGGELRLSTTVTASFELEK